MIRLAWARALIVDLFDANNKQVAWRAAGRATLNQGNSNKNRQLIDEAVSKMFRQYLSPSNK